MKEEITRLRKLRKWKNNVEIKRIDIAIELLKWKWYKEIKKEMSCGESTISYVKKNYKKDKEKFYKTKYKWAKEKFGKEYSNKIIRYIEERSENNKGCTIRDIVDFLWLERNKKSYEFVWYMTRRKNNLNYQKPYVQDKKSPKNAKEILKKKYKGKHVLK